MEIHKPYQCLPVGCWLCPVGKLGTDWHVFDDHVCINENVCINPLPGISTDKVFMLDYRHVGMLRLLIMKNGDYPVEGGHYERVDNTGRVGLNLQKP